MKRYCLFIATLLLTLAASAQSFTPKRLRLLSSDLLAQTSPRMDKNDKKCAVIRVDVVGIQNIKFKEAIGEVDYSANEYIVYVPEGTKILTCTFGGSTSTIKLEDYGPEIEDGRVYCLTLETENKMRSAIFYVKPASARLVIDGKNVPLDGNGKGTLNLPIGKYEYAITADGHMKESGQIELKEDEIFTSKDIELEAITHRYIIDSNLGSALLFVDDKPLGTIESLGRDIPLTEGKHSIRATHEGYKDFEKNITVTQGGTLEVRLQKMKDKIVYYSNERTKSSISLRRHTDILFGTHTFMDDMLKTVAGRFATEYHQYLGYLSFKEGLGFAGTRASEDFIDRIDKNYSKAFTDSVHKLALTIDIPLQAGFTIPLSRFNTSQLSILAGVYGSMYYIGHKSEHMMNGKGVTSTIFDYGLRGDVNFYFNKFVVSFEGNYCLNKKRNLGSYVGFSIGWRIYKSED